MRKIRQKTLMARMQGWGALMFLPAPVYDLGLDLNLVSPDYDIRYKAVRVQDEPILKNFVYLYDSKKPGTYAAWISRVKDVVRMTSYEYGNQPTNTADMGIGYNRLVKEYFYKSYFKNEVRFYRGRINDIKRLGLASEQRLCLPDFQLRNGISEDYDIELEELIHCFMHYMVVFNSYIDRTNDWSYMFIDYIEGLKEGILKKQVKNAFNKLPAFQIMLIEHYKLLLEDEKEARGYTPTNINSIYSPAMLGIRSSNPDYYANMLMSTERYLIIKDALAMVANARAQLTLSPEGNGKILPHGEREKIAVEVRKDEIFSGVAVRESGESAGGSKIIVNDEGMDDAERAGSLKRHKTLNDRNSLTMADDPMSMLGKAVVVPYVSPDLKIKTTDGSEFNEEISNIPPPPFVKEIPNSASVVVMRPNYYQNGIGEGLSPVFLDDNFIKDSEKTPEEIAEEQRIFQMLRDEGLEAPKDNIDIMEKIRTEYEKSRREQNDEIETTGEIEEESEQNDTEQIDYDSIDDGAFRREDNYKFAAQTIRERRQDDLENQLLTFDFIYDMMKSEVRRSMAKEDILEIMKSADIIPN